MGAKRVSTQGVRVSQGNAIEVTNASDAVVFSVDSTGALGKVANLTTTGDILYASSANTPARLGIGTSSQVLTVAGGVPTWATPTVGDITAVTAGTGISGGGTSGDVTITNSMATAIDAKGDLVGGTGADAFARLAVGANGTVLTADSDETTGLKWVAPATVTTFPAFRAYQSTNQSITANTFTKINFQTESFDQGSCFASNRFTPNVAGKYYFHWTLDLSSISVRDIFFYKNGANVAGMFFNSPQSHAAMQNSLFFDMNGTTDYMEVYCYINEATTIQSGSEYSYFEGFGVRA